MGEIQRQIFGFVVWSGGGELDSIPPETVTVEAGYRDREEKERDFLTNVSWADGFYGAVVAGYNQKICWFLNYFLDLDPTDSYQYEPFVEEHKIYYNDSEGLGFKMNLFPLNFPSHNRDWS